MFEATAREYFQGASHHFLVPATDATAETVQLVCSMELLAIFSMFEVGSKLKVSFGASLNLPRVFEQ